MTKRAQKPSSSKKKGTARTQKQATAKNVKKAQPDAPSSVSYQDYLIESLKDPEEAAGYLTAALEGGDVQVFLLALHNVIQAQGGMKELATKTHKSRTSLYKSLSVKGNPYLKNANDMLLAMGMRLSVVPNNQGSSH